MGDSLSKWDKWEKEKESEGLVMKTLRWGQFGGINSSGRQS